MDVDMRSSSLSPPPPHPPSSPEPTTTTDFVFKLEERTPTKKPKSERKQHHSPTPPPIVPPPPLQTIRLDITLGGPENYEVDINTLALILATGPSSRRNCKAADTSESEQEEEQNIPVVPGKKKKRKNFQQEYYDTNDPFIDDSELAVDDRKFFAQTKQRGFYVSAGQVALLKDKSSPVKPKSRIKMAPIDGSRESPIALDGTDDEHTDRGAVAGQKRKRYLSVTENGKKRKIIDVTSFHPRLQTAIDDLKAAIAKEDWSNKGKFPPNIKPILAQTALLAVELDEYDDDFFNLMPTLFPYNKFTMTKLIKRTIFVEHTALLVRRQDALLEQLGKLATEGFKKAEEDWQNAVVAWDRRQEKARQQKEAEGGFEGTSTARTGTSEPPGPPTRPGSPAGDEGEEGKNGREPHPPSKKYRMTDAMKNIVWELVLLSNESCRLENEKNQLENSIIQVSEQGLRKVLYQKIVAVFPEGWMSSGQISRDVSAIKKRLEKEQLEGDGLS
ncbi:hypothetical protein CPB85DRAFT_1310857 [Mucidula mucida]|nr:hypothetical protein CPB85DRAFT_1310857 [Mucidula mucida]